MKEILQDGAPLLRSTAEPVPETAFGSEQLQQLITDMSEVLDAAPEGVAIAAPQIGTSWRLFAVRMDRTFPAPPEGSEGQPEADQERPASVEVYINPEIVKTSRKRVRADEGCLSVRDVYGTTLRHERVTIKARTPDGGHVIRGSGGLLAQIFEHEIDHLNGILFTDHAEHLIRVTHEQTA